MVNNGYNSLRRLYNNVFLLCLNKKIRNSRIVAVTVLHWIEKGNLDGKSWLYAGIRRLYHFKELKPYIIFIN